ncbi:MAG: hypothetical protein Phog2KO_41820 [Phototrophicaceae bacterium]
MEQGMNKHRNFLFAIIFFIFIFSTTFLVLAQASINLIVRNQDTFIIDANDNNLADIGDVIRYTVVVANCGSETAQNTQYNSIIDSNTQLNANSVTIGAVEGVESGICPESTSDTPANNDNTNPDPSPVIVNTNAVDDVFTVTNGASNNVNITLNDSGNTPVHAVSFGDSLANVSTFPADGATVGAFSAPGGGTIDVTIAVNGDMVITANGTVGTGTVTIFYEIQAGNGSTDTAQITLTFGDFPTAVDDTQATLGIGNEYSTVSGVDLNIPAGTGLLNNDTLGTPAGTLTLWGGGDASATVTLIPTSSIPLAGGTLTVNTDGSFDLVNPTTAGTYTFSYIINNGIGTSQGSVEIYIEEPPVANDDALTASINITNNYVAPALFNDNGSGADTLGSPAATVASFGGGSLAGDASTNAAGSTIAIPVLGGTLTVNADGSVVVDTPTTTGTFTFNYRLTNAAGSNDATVTITVVSTPVTQDDAFAVTIGNNLSGDITTNNGSGADTAGVPAFTGLTFGAGDLGGTVTSNNGGASVTLAGGTLSISNTGAITLNGATTAGTYTFDYQLTNATGTSNISTVTIQVQELPVANDDALTATTGVTNNYIAPTLFNDNGSGADTLGTPAATVASFGGGSLAGDASTNAAGSTIAIPVLGGTLTVNADGSVVVDTPTTTGTFTFNYRLTNAAGSNDATVTITVQEIPVAEDDTFNINFDAASPFISGDLNNANGGLADNLGFPNATITQIDGAFGTVATPANVAFADGTLNVAADGTISLTNSGNLTPGQYTFTYTLSNVAGNDTATVTINVFSSPSAVVDAISVNLGSSTGSIPAATGLRDTNDTYTGPAVYETATITGANDVDNTVGLTIGTLYAIPGTGGATLRINADGSYILDATVATTSGSFNFNYTLSNSHPTTSTANLTVTINEAPTAVDDAYTFAPNVNQSVAAGAGLFANNGSGLDNLGSPTATLVSFGGGSLAGDASTNTATTSVGLAGGILTVNSDGSWTLTGQPFTSGTYTFDYRLNNSVGSSNATVTLQIGTPAVCAVDSYSATGNVRINTTTVAGNDVLQNDTGTAISVTAVQGVGANVGVDTATANAGTVNMTSAGEFTYDPPAGFTGDDTFTYTIDNASASPSTCTVTITVSDMVYFMDSSAGAGGNGTLARPFQTIAEHNGAPPIANSFLYVEDNGVTYSGNLLLVSGQTVIGEGATGTLFGGGSRTGIMLAPLSVTVPSLTGNGSDRAQFSNASGDGITVNSNNTIIGIEVNMTSGYAFIDNGASIGTLTIEQSEIASSGGLLSFTNGGTVNATFDRLTSSSHTDSAIELTNMNGTIFNASGVVTNTANVDTITISGGAVNITTNTSFNKTGGTGELLSVINGHTGTFTFINTMASSSGSGMLFNNADGTYNFNGILTIDGTTAGVNIQNGSGGTLSVSNTSSNIQGIQGIPFRINSSAMTVDYNGNITHRQGVGSLLTERVVEIISGTGVISFDGQIIHGDNVNRGTAETVFLSNTGVANTISFGYVDSGVNNTATFVSNTSGNVSINQLRANCQGNLTIGGDTHCIQISDTTSSGFTIEALSVDLDDGGENGGAISLITTPGTWTVEDISGGLTGRLQTLIFGNNFGTLNIATVNSATSPGGIVAGGITGDSATTIDLSNGTVNVDFTSLNGFDTPDHVISLTNVDGPLFRIQGATVADGDAGSNELINLQDVSTTTVNISDNSTVAVTNRRSQGIRVANATSTTMTFGATTISNAQASTQPALFLSNTTTAIDFDTLLVNQGNVGTGETFVVSFPNDNLGLGDAVYANGATGGLTINAGTISNILDDGFDWRNSGILTLNNVTINHQHGTTGTAGIQAFNSTGVAMTNGSIVNFASAAVGGQRPLAINILHNASYASVTGTFTFNSVDFDGNTGAAAGTALGGGIAQFLEDNASIALEVTNGSTFADVFGKAIITQNGSTTGGTVTTTVTDNFFNSPLAGGQSSIEVASGGAGMNGNVSFNINNNTFSSWGSGAGTAILINLNQAGNARAQTNTINGNSITGGTGITMIGVIIDETSGLRLQANNNTGSVNSTGEALKLQALATWTAGEVDISMNGGSYVTSGLSAAQIDNSGAGDMQVLVNNVTLQTTDGFPFEGLYLGNRGAGTMDAIFTNTSFLALDYALYVTQNNTGTMCLDLNDDGGGNNIFNTGYQINRTSGTLNLENGNTPATINGNNTFIGAGVQQVNGAVTAFGGECTVATP